MGVQFCLFSLFSVFVYSLARLCILSVDATRIKRSLLFCFFVAAFAVVVGLSLFLVMHLLSPLHAPIDERPRIKRSLTFGAFVALWDDSNCFATVF